MPGIAAVILAAGGSSRLGRPKQLVELNGQPLIARAVAVAAEAGCAPIIVVVGRDADACAAALAGTPAVVCRNDDWAVGMGTSIRAGFRALPADVTRAVLMLCDQPRVTADTVRRLDAAHLENGVAVCVAAYAGTVGPPVLVSGDALAKLRDWPATDGAKRLWMTRDGVHTVACPEAAFDVDTDADVAKLIVRHPNRGSTL